MHESKLSHTIDQFINGNGIAFRSIIRRADKITILELCEYVHGSQLFNDAPHIINAMRSALNNTNE
jgi:hypothetical protein